MAIMSLGVLLTMAALYILLFLRLSGALKKTSALLHQGSSTGGSSSSDPYTRSPTPVDTSRSASDRRRQVRAVARKMLWYPLSYAVLSVPLVSCVLLGAKTTPLPHTYYIASNSAFASISESSLGTRGQTRTC